MKIKWLFIFSMMAELALANQVDLLRCVSELRNIDPVPSTIEYQQGLAFGSMRIGDRNGRDHTWLLVANDRLIRIFPLNPGRLNRLSFYMDHVDRRLLPVHTFISFAHSEVFGSRLIQLSSENPPPGRAPSDFRETAALSLDANTSRAYFLQLIMTEMKRLQQQFAAGRLSRQDLLSGNLSLCRGLVSRDLKLTVWINRQITELESVSTARRLPASE